MPDVTTVDFHFDVLCPYADQTSKWIVVIQLPQKRDAADAEASARTEMSRQ